MKKTTLCFCINNDQVLLGMKKIGFGSGKWNGFGGKLEENESPKSAAVRELKEEAKLVADPNDLEQFALINFYFDQELTFECHIYITHKWQGEPVETQEMKPEWFSISELPFEKMWVADTKWLPLILKGEKIKAEVKFNNDGSKVEDFTHEPMNFN